MSTATLPTTPPRLGFTFALDKSDCNLLLRQRTRTYATGASSHRVLSIERRGWRIAYDFSVQPLVHRRWAAIVSSCRRGRLELDRQWRLRVLAALNEIAASGAVLLTNHFTPVGPFIAHAAKRLELETLRIEMDDVLNVTSRYGNGPSILICDRGLQDSIAVDAVTNTQSIEYPKIDRISIGLPDDVYAIEVAPGSKTHQLLKLRLRPRMEATKEFASNSTVYLYSQVEDLAARGAISVSSDEDKAAICDASASKKIERSGQISPSRSSTRIQIENRSLDDADHFSLQQTAASQRSVSTLLPVWNRSSEAESFFGTEHDFLTHCTRSRCGSWPDQSNEQYFDELIADQSIDNPTPFETLLRIVKSRVLLATNRLKQGSIASVSFSAVPLRRLLGMRTYRQHIRRWDWEPYGIAVRKEYLCKLGAKEVRYFDLMHDDSIPETTRLETRMFDAASRWREEQEWRLPSDLQLEQLETQQSQINAFLFVSSKEEAAVLRSLTSIPVLEFTNLKRP